LATPLWTTILALATLIGLPSFEVAIGLSSLGWALSAAALIAALRGHARDNGRLLVALLLLVLNPVLPATLGTEIPMVVALATCSIVAGWERRWFWQNLSTYLLCGFLFDWTALLLLTGLLAWRRHVSGRWPLWPTGTLFLVALAWLLAAYYRGVAPFSQAWGDLAVWPAHLERLGRESEYYWLFVPVIAAGLWQLRVRFGQSSNRERRHTSRFFVGLLLSTLMVSIRAPLIGLGLAAVASSGLAFTGLAWAAGRLRRGQPKLAFANLTLIAAMPLFLAQGVSLWKRYEARPVDLDSLEKNAGLWLKSHSEMDALVLSQAHTGYVSGLRNWSWRGRRSDALQLPQLLARMIDHPPDYVVSSETIAWRQLLHTRWFRQRYDWVEEFDSAYEASAPLLIWRYQHSEYDRAPLRDIELETEIGLKLASYRYWPESIKPGEAIHLSLTWQVEEQLDRAFKTVVRLVDREGAGYAQRDEDTPRSLPLHWIETGGRFTERYVLTTTTGIDVGGYQLNLSLYRPGEEQLLGLRQGKDSNLLDRALLGHVPVPWDGADPATLSLLATFDNQIALKGFESGVVAPGKPLPVTLYWEALRLPSDDYKIFVHLLDDANQYLTGDDALPMGGAYPTLAWQPGHVVPDEHFLDLPDELPAGSLALTVGLTLASTGERLTVQDALGATMADGIFPLDQFAVTP
jgi:hypothetical protein